MEKHEPDLLVSNGTNRHKEENKPFVPPAIPRKTTLSKPVKDDPPVPTTPTNFSEAIYDAILKDYANKNPSQLFCLNWPGTILDYDRMMWDKSEETAGNMPEYALIRSSQILDQYVPPAPITQPDGTRVSDRYRQAISQIGPIPNKNLLKLQHIIRTRLNKTVTVDINGTSQEMTLVDWFSYLYKKWTDARRKWGQLQEKMMEKFKAQFPFDKKQWWNAYLNWYELNADSYIDSINAAYDQLIVEFPLNEWQDAIAIIDSSDNAMLTEARDLVRNLRVPVPKQEGIDYVPTQGVPYSWPLELKPVSKFLDYLADPEMQQQQVDTALDQLRLQVMTWMAILPQLDDEQIKQDADAFNKAEQAYSKAQEDIIKQYNSNAVEAVKIYCDIMITRGINLPGITSADEQAKLTEEIGKLSSDINEQKTGNPIPPADRYDWTKITEIADKIADGNNSLIEKQQALIDSGTELAGSALKFLEDEANRTKFTWLQGYITQLEEQIKQLEQQQKNHSSAANNFYKYNNSEGGFGEDAKPSKFDAPENMRWTEQKITVNISQLKSDKTMNTFFSRTQWGVDLFLGSAGGNYENSGAHFADTYMEENSEIEIGFLSTKVLIDRPWMRPELFQQSAKFFRTMPTPVSYTKPIMGDDLIKDQKLVLDLVNNYSLPAYPVAILLAKDVCVRVKIKMAETDNVRDMEKKVKSQGGGFLCFSISSTSASESNNESMSSYCMAGQMIARAPSPQIIGYWVQLMPPDLSHELTEQDTNEITESLGFLEQLNAAHDAGATVKEKPQQP